jgi:hypothetical protein
MSNADTLSDAVLQAQPLIAVRDVRASSIWYQCLLHTDPLPETPQGAGYVRIAQDGRLVLQLHGWAQENYPNISDPDAAPVGHGVLLWFQLGDFDALLNRVQELHAEIVRGPLLNPASGNREVWVRDPDRYVVVLTGTDGQPRASGGH